MLSGTEIKSLRNGKANIADSYASVEGGELWLINCYIPEYLQANRYNHEPRRRRKILVHRKQLAKLYQSTEREGMTIVPLNIHYNDKGRAKLELGIARGKKLHDKRETEKERDWIARERAAAAGQGLNLVLKLFHLPPRRGPLRNFPAHFLAQCHQINKMIRLTPQIVGNHRRLARTVEITDTFLPRRCRASTNTRKSPSPENSTK